MGREYRFRIQETGESNSKSGDSGDRIQETRCPKIGKALPAAHGSIKSVQKRRTPQKRVEQLSS
jgi:hypothetical protein